MKLQYSLGKAALKSMVRVLALLMPLYLAMTGTAFAQAADGCAYPNNDVTQWGWNESARESCAPLSVDVELAACMDPDGDGYGWNGVSTCDPNGPNDPDNSSGYNPSFNLDGEYSCANAVLWNANPSYWDRVGAEGFIVEIDGSKLTVSDEYRTITEDSTWDFTNHQMTFHGVRYNQFAFYTTSYSRGFYLYGSDVERIDCQFVR